MGRMSQVRHDAADDDYAYPPRHPRRPLLIGIAGLASAFCCPPLGIGLGIASIAQVRRNGGTVAWGALAIAASVVTTVLGAILVSTR
jgi:hypothetical protein